MGQPGPELGTGCALLQAAAGVRTLAGSPRRALPFSMDCWIATEAGQGVGNLIEYNGLSTTDGCGIGWDAAGSNTQTLHLVRGGIAVSGAFSSVSAVNWHHLALTLDAASTFNEYLDGVLIGGPAVAAINPIGVSSPFIVGAASFTNQLLYMAHAALYPTVLTAARVLAHFSAPAVLQRPAVVGGSTSGDTAAMLSLLNLIYAAVHKTY